MVNRLVWSASLGCALALGCTPTYIETCADGYVFNADRTACIEAGDTGPTPDANSDAFSLFDAFAPDAGVDAFMPDSGTDGGICSRCPTATPACLGGTSCVQCTADNTTACNTDTPACDTGTNTCVQCNVSTDCSGATPVCNVDTHLCVPCRGAETGACSTTPTTPACDTNNTCTCTATSCTSLTAARCDEGSNGCAPCMADTDCARFGATPVCDESRGVCVQCTGDTEAARCVMNSCRRSDGTCTMRRRGLSDTCDACEADSECTTGQRCVRHVFGGTDVGSFCFLDAAIGGCGDTNVLRRPYRTRLPLSSIDGVAATYCMPPSATTCQGIRDTQSEACTMDSECGDARVADGFCPTTGTGAGACTYACTGGFDCGGTLNCGGTPQHCRPPL